MTRTARDTVRVGVLGCGTVGAEAIRILARRRDPIKRYAGVDVEVVRVAVRDAAKDRDVPLPASVFTTDAASIVSDDDVDLVVELMGGIDPAGKLVQTALEAGKPVVTGNKELMAKSGPELLDAAEAAHVDLLFEAAVGGGIPLIRPLTESLAGEHILRVMGIVNGTTNYILTRMAEEGSDLESVLADAQRLGYAEADPTADVDGHDAAQKAAILATLAFGTRVHADEVSTEGIRGIAARDIEMATRLGYVVKLLAIAEFAPEGREDGAVSVRVHPAMLPATHPLASVRLSFNAVFVEGESAGEMMFYGHGAGSGPTAVAVVGDVVDAARNLRQGARGPHISRANVHPVRGVDELESRFYVRVDVVDRPGVLGALAGVFGDHDVSISAVIQEGRGDDAELVLVTHPCREREMAATVQTLRGLDDVEEVAAVIRVLSEEDG